METSPRPVLGWLRDVWIERNEPFARVVVGEIYFTALLLVGLLVMDLLFRATKLAGMDAGFIAVLQWVDKAAFGIIFAVFLVRFVQHAVSFNFGVFSEVRRDK